VTGFDLSPGMVEEARRRFPELPFEVADLAALPRRDWAAITAWYALVHHGQSELPGTIAALAAALRPGGWLAVAVHEGDEARHRDEWYGHDVHLDFSFHRREDVLAALAAAGFEPAEWYLRGPTGPEATQRLYAIARRG
jgi:SAM-dependent methyltransferase